MKFDKPFVARLAVVVLAYFLAGWVGLKFATYAGAITLIWPPAGIALFALLGWGLRLWPGIWLGALLVNLLVNPLPLPVAVVIACGNTAGPLLAAWWLRRLRFNQNFATVRDLLLYVGIGVVGGMVINAGVGSVSLLAGGLLPATALGETWRTWWLGDVLGALIVGPALLLWQARRAAGAERMSRTERRLAWGGLLLVTLLVATPLSPLAGALPPILTIPFVVWLAHRGNRYDASLATLLICALVVWGTLAGVGSFVSPGGGVELVRLRTLMITIGMVSLLVTALSRESRQTSEALRTERDFNDKVLATAGNVVIVLDDAGRIVRFNRAAEELTGWRVEELIGQPIWDFLIPLEQLEAVRGVFEKLRRGQGGADAGRYENEWLLRDGGRRLLEWRNTVLQDEKGAITHVVALGYDITERRAAERRIEMDREQQATLRRLLETVLEGGGVETTLDRCLDILLSISWLSHESMAAVLLVENDGQGLRLVASRHMSAGTPVTPVTPVDVGHGTLSPGTTDHGNYRVPLVSHGRLVGVLALDLLPGVPRDPINEAFVASVAGVLVGYLGRAEAEQSLVEHQANLEQVVKLQTTELVENQRRLETIIDNLPQIFFMKDAQGRYTMINRMYLEEVGIARDQVIGHTDEEIHPPTVAEAIIDMDRRVMEGMAPATYEEYAPHADGSCHDYLTSKAPLVDSQGQVYGLIGSATDITSLKELQREANAAKVEAERLARVKSAFLANMSHEIRTPLNGVLGLARIGVRENQGRKTGQTCARILASGEHLLGVINDILDFSKIEAGKLRVEKRPFALRAALDSVTSFVAARAEAKGLALSVALAPDLSDWVEGDSLRLTQILTNLLSNAIKFTERGEVRLRAARDGDDIFFRVLDTGIGMNEEQLARLFQPFEQADNSTTRHYGGTGLGLAISHSLVQLMGGDITVDSRPGVGSSFYLRLCLVAASAPEHPSQPKNAPAATGPRLAGLSVLAADDVEVNRLVLEDLLTHEGARVVFAHDGLQALERLEEVGVSRFDVVLMDVQMPVMDGIEATRRIAAIAPDLPVIGLTAHALAEERDRCLAAGMVEHVTKPIDVNVLVAAILRHVRPAVRSGEKVGAGGTAVDVSKGAVTAAADAPPPAAPGMIDHAALLDRFNGRREFIAKLAASARKQHGGTPARLRDAARAGDRETLAFLAHGLKGLGGNLDAGPLREAAMALETAAKAGSDDTPALAEPLAAVLEATLKELAELEND